MSDVCPKCYGTLGFFHDCDSSNSSSSEGFSSFAKPRRVASLAAIIGAGPLMGIVFDFFLPLPSSLIHSVLVSILGSTFVGLMWVVLRHEGSKSFKFYLRNFKNFAYTPSMLKIFTSGNQKSVIPTWVGAIALSSLLQLVLFTPGNAAYLEFQVTSQINDASGADLKTECKSNKLYFYNSRIECRVKTGLLGISVPARAKLSPLFGSSDIKVSLL